MLQTSVSAFSVDTTVEINLYLLFHGMKVNFKNEVNHYKY